MDEFLFVIRKKRKFLGESECAIYLLAGLSEFVIHETLYS